MGAGCKGPIGHRPAFDAVTYVLVSGERRICASNRRGLLELMAADYAAEGMADLAIREEVAHIPERKGRTLGPRPKGMEPH